MMHLVGVCPNQVIKGVHCGVREVALKMLLNVEDPDMQLQRFTKVLLHTVVAQSPSLLSKVVQAASLLCA